MRQSFFFFTINSGWLAIPIIYCRRKTSEKESISRDVTLHLSRVFSTNSFSRPTRLEEAAARARDSSSSSSMTTTGQKQGDRKLSKWMRPPNPRLFSDGFLSRESETLLYLCHFSFSLPLISGWSEDDLFTDGFVQMELRRECDASVVT